MAIRANNTTGLGTIFQRVVREEGAGAVSGVPSGARFSSPDDIGKFEEAAVRDLERQSDRTSSAEAGIISTARSEGLADRVAGAQARANRASNVIEGTFERQTRGQDLSDRQRSAARRRLSLSRRLAQTRAGTAEGLGTAKRARSAQQAAGGLEDQLFSQELSGLSNLANAEGQHQLQQARERAEKRANRNALLGSVVGLAGAAIASSEAIKNKEGLAENMLDKLRKIRVEKWRYKGDSQSHVGPYAEEFNDTFGVNQGNRGMISLVDAVGVLMGSVKELSDKVDARA